MTFLKKRTTITKTTYPTKIKNKQLDFAQYSKTVNCKQFLSLRHFVLLVCMTLGCVYIYI